MASSFFLIAKNDLKWGALDISSTHPTTDDDGVIMLVAIGLEIQEMSWLKPQNIPKWNTCSRYFDHTLYKNDSNKKKSCKLRLQRGKTSQKALDMIWVFLKGTIVKPKMIQMNLKWTRSLVGFKTPHPFLSLFLITIKQKERKCDEGWRLSLG